MQFFFSQNLHQTADCKISNKLTFPWRKVQMFTRIMAHFSGVAVQIKKDLSPISLQNIGMYMKVKVLIAIIMRCQSYWLLWAYSHRVVFQDCLCRSVESLYGILLCQCWKLFITSLEGEGIKEMKAQMEVLPSSSVQRHRQYTNWDSRH